jgi:hypothetical protein
MSTTRILWIVLGSVLVLGLLGAGGYALYRLGYAHGVQSSDIVLMPGDFHDEFFHHFEERYKDRFHPGDEGRFMDGFGGRFYFEQGRSRLPGRSAWSVSPFMILWVIPGLLFFVGFVALAIVGVNALIQSRRDVEETSTKSGAKK